MDITKHPLGFYIVAPSGAPSKFAPPETVEQQAFVSWLRASNIPHHSIPNGAATNKVRGALMKKEGLSPGVPDLFIYWQGKNIAIEMKKANGKYSDFSKKQIDWMTFLAGHGWLVIGAMGCAAARKALESLV